MFIIDRFDSPYAICEDTSLGSTVYIPINIITYKASEGDVLVRKGNLFYQDTKKQESRQKHIASLLEKLYSQKSNNDIGKNE